jgi:hypothetical protein
MSRSKLPWTCAPIGSIYSGDDLIGSMGGTPGGTDTRHDSKANAEFVVKACNNYHELVRWLKEFHEDVLAVYKNANGEFDEERMQEEWWDLCTTFIHSSGFLGDLEGDQDAKVQEEQAEPGDR